MIIPIRCFTCGKVIANKWETYEERCRDADDKSKKSRKYRGRGDGDDGKSDDPDVVKKTDRGIILDELGLTSICCRTMLLTHVDMTLTI